jgi:hypothetical protein
VAFPLTPFAPHGLAHKLGGSQAATTLCAQTELLMSHFRFRFEIAGGHVHMRLFAGKSSEVTHGKCGDLCMTYVEFLQFREHVKSSEFEFVEENFSKKEQNVIG